MFCRYCGNEVNDDSHFCSKCGKNILTEDNSEKPIIENNSLPDNANTEKPINPISKIKQQPFFNTNKSFYCTYCGTYLGKNKICPNCNSKKNNGINLFCSFCGSSIENGKCSNSNISVKITFFEKLLRFISIFLIYFTFLGVLTKIFDGDYLSAIVMGAISLFCNIFIIPTQQIYKLKSILSAKNIKQASIYFVYIIVIISLILGINFARKNDIGLSGDNLEAYNLITEVSYEFKNPSSVRIVSGKVFYSEEDAEWCGWFALSATNSYGATTVGYYFVGYLDGEIFALDLEDNDTGSTSIKYAKTQGELNINKINNALNKKWKQSNFS